MFEVILSDGFLNSFSSVSDYSFSLGTVVKLEKLLEYFGHRFIAFIEHNRKSKNNDLPKTVETEQYYKTIISCSLFYS